MQQNYEESQNHCVLSVVEEDSDNIVSISQKNLGLDLQLHTFHYKAEIVLFGSMTELNAIA